MKCFLGVFFAGVLAALPSLIFGAPVAMSLITDAPGEHWEAAVDLARVADVRIRLIARVGEAPATYFIEIDHHEHDTLGHSRGNAQQIIIGETACAAGGTPQFRTDMTRYRYRTTRFQIPRKALETAETGKLVWEDGELALTFPTAAIAHFLKRADQEDEQRSRELGHVTEGDAIAAKYSQHVAARNERLRYRDEFLAKHPELTKRQRNDILNRTISVEMSQEEIIAAVGPPDKRQPSTEFKGDEIWIYGDEEQLLVLHFRGGKLLSTKVAP